ncbi:MAG: hybrid sensor histidine kinase/response regulator [Caulobacter sp.]|nr:hybrid sensor histidine kinase/response regulator [Caulobacter sp.]
MTEQRRTSERPTHAPLQARIAGVALVTTVAALVAACLCFMVQQWSVARQEARANHEVLAEMVAAGAAMSLANHDAVGAARALDAVGRAPHVAGAKLIDRRGQVLARVGVDGGADGLDTLTRRVDLAGRPVGTVALVARQPHLAEILARDLALTGTLFFGSAGLAILLANSLARRMARPMQRLSMAMEDVAAGGRLQPVPPAADDDVFHSLTTSFNHLVAKLDANDHDLRQAMAELVKARDDANAANVLKSHFLANMSHEIRTPLNGVLAMTEIMSMDALTPSQRDRLAVIRQSGTSLLAVLNDVLDLSKIEAGRLELAPRDFDLQTLADGLREAYAPQAREKNLSFAVVVAAEAAGAWRGDADRLGQILQNLVSNALKFTLTGSVTVRFASAEDGSGLRVDVADTGIGVAAEALPVLFEKFVQADSSTTRRFGGSGLGLAICRELATLMGGTVAVQSREGQGSTFTVLAPMPRGDAAAVRPEPAPFVATPESVGKVVDDIGDVIESRRLRVLAADDNPTNQKVVEAVLGPLGAEVRVVADGEACVAAWREGGYDIILMDIHMPVMDGLEAAHAIRLIEAAESLPRVPIVAVTANALAHQVEGYLAAGMDGHVAKPIEVTKLYAAIEQAMAAARMAAAA